MKVVIGYYTESSLFKMNLEKSVYGCDVDAKVIMLESPLGPPPDTSTTITKVREYVNIPKVDLNATVVPTAEVSLFGLDVKNKEGLTSLHIASKAGHLGVVAVLLEAGADINARDVDGNTALSLASGEGHVDVVRKLVDWLRGDGR